MQGIRNYLAHRVLWSVFWLGLGLFQIVPNLGTHDVGEALTGTGLVFLGFLCFLQPPILSLSFSAMVDRAKNIAVGPPAIRIALVVAMVFCTIIGFVLRHGAKA